MKQTEPDQATTARQKNLQPASPKFAERQKYERRKVHLARKAAEQANLSEITDANQMLTTEDAAALLGLKPATLSNWREDGSADLPFSKFGRSVRYRYSDVIAFADRSRCTSTLAARNLK